MSRSSALSSITMAGKGRNHIIALAAIAFVALDAILWHALVTDRARPGETGIHFLDVGQGDATLIILPGGVKMLIDAGPGDSVIGELESVMPPKDRYIDIAMISHPQRDHFGGLQELLERYTVGIVLTNGRDADAGSEGEWEELKRSIEEEGIPVVVLERGDVVRNGASSLSALWPEKKFLQSADLNDTAIVALLRTGELAALFTADIGADIEKILAEKDDLRATILKVGHHGSKYSSSEEFLKEVSPGIAVIEVGENRYGHPSPEALARLARIAPSGVFRTDKNGTVSAVTEGRTLKIFTER